MKHYQESPDFYNLEENMRVVALDSNCESKDENYTHTRNLTEGEIKKKNDEINQALQEVKRLKEERKELNKAIKAQTDTVLVNNEEIISRQVKVTETVWFVSNVETGILEAINKAGLIVDTIQMNSPRMINMFRAAKQQEAI